MADTKTTPLRFLRIRAVTEKTGNPQSTVYRMVSEGQFPRPVRLGPNRVAWLESEVDQWMRERIAARDGEAA